MNMPEVDGYGTVGPHTIIRSLIASLIRTLEMQLLIGIVHRLQITSLKFAIWRCMYGWWLKMISSVLAARIFKTKNNVLSVRISKDSGVKA